ncbi:MAG: PHP domain-containing protein [Treponema sp.]|jgi:predicted metal-dependent phosphoesterase TrpH|nr:PHP domain-containing protein [Treponema sp.]
MIDLHTHSTASDGSLTPAELIAAGAARGLKALALTDHDTINGLAEANEASIGAGIRFIPGIELEINGAREAIQGEFHLLGLGITNISQAFTEAVAMLTLGREKRNREILDRMEELSIKASYDEIKAFSGGHIIGRPHFAAFLVKRRIAKNIPQAFDRYLGKGKTLYVPKPGLEFDHAVSIIKESGGLAILAHPMSLYVAWGRLPGFIKNLQSRGLQGIEAWHPTARVSECKRLEELGKSLGLYLTAGSDFHGNFRPDRKLGITAGNRKIEDSLLDAIPELGNGEWGMGSGGRC